MSESKALPAFCYRDPAEVVERNELLSLGCRACSSLVVVLNRPMCQDSRNESQKGVPGIGIRCRYFREAT